MSPPSRCVLRRTFLRPSNGLNGLATAWLLRAGLLSAAVHEASLPPRPASSGFSVNSMMADAATPRKLRRLRGTRGRSLRPNIARAQRCRCRQSAPLSTSAPNTADDHGGEQVAGELPWSPPPIRKVWTDTLFCSAVGERRHGAEAAADQEQQNLELQKRHAGARARPASAWRRSPA